MRRALEVLLPYPRPPRAAAIAGALFDQEPLCCEVQTCPALTHCPGVAASQQVHPGVCLNMLTTIKFSLLQFGNHVCNTLQGMSDSLAESPVAWKRRVDGIAAHLTVSHASAAGRPNTSTGQVFHPWPDRKGAPLHHHSLPAHGAPVWRAERAAWHPGLQPRGAACAASRGACGCSGEHDHQPRHAVSAELGDRAAGALAPFCA